jgi:hypothetical protein
MRDMDEILGSIVDAAYKIHAMPTQKTRAGDLSGF